MPRSLASHAFATLSALALVAAASTSSLAQADPVRVLQTGDGSVYLAQGGNAWTMVPNPISDADLAGLTPSGDLVGAIPAPFLSTSSLPAPLQVVQGGDGTLYLVQASNVWTLVPTPITDADLAALAIVGELNGDITAPGLVLPPPEAPPAVAEPAPAPEPAVPPPPGPPPAPISPPATRPPTAPTSGALTIVSSLPRTGPDKTLTDTVVNAFKMSIFEHNNTVLGVPINYQDMDDATAAKQKWDAAQEASNANIAINDRNVVAYIGTFDSGATKVTIPILCRPNLVMLSPAASYPGFTKQTSATYPGEPGVYYPIGCKRNFGRLVPTDDLEGATPSNWPQQLGPKSSHWYQSYKQQFNSEPDIHALYGYEAMNVVIDAIQRAGSKDRAAIRDAVLGTRNYDGVLGRWSFDSNGDISGISAPLPGSR